MGSRIDIYSLYELPSDSALLLRVERRDSSNVNEDDYQASINEAYELRDRLLSHATVALDLPAGFVGKLIGEFQDIPVGELLYETPDGGKVGVWVAPTRFGHPWVIMGTAPDEESFWEEVRTESDLDSLEASRPARFYEVYFFSDHVFER